MGRLSKGCLFGALILGLAGGCTDVGDSSAIPGGPGAEASGAGGGDGAATAIDAGALASDAATTAVDGSLWDATLPASDDGGDSGGPAGDAAIADAGVADGDVSDATVPEDAAVDASMNDAAPVDAAPTVDGSVVADAGAPVDGGTEADGAAPLDAGEDAGAADSGRDAADASPGSPTLAPCTTPGQSGCVQCQYNNGTGGTLPNATQTCTPTEAVFVQHDIMAGTASAAGPDPDGSCYQCAALSGCLDDSMFGDVGHECEDLSGSTAAGACEATITCILGSACGGAAISGCYCGTAPVSGACAAVGASNGANGACAAQESAGLGFAANDGLDILKNFTSTTLPSGVANNIFQCAASNGCDACLK